MIKFLLYFLIIIALFTFNTFAEFPTWITDAPEITVTSMNANINVRVPVWNIDSDIETGEIINEQIDWCLNTNNAIYFTWLESNSDKFQIYAALLNQTGDLAWKKLVYEHKTPQNELRCITMQNNNLLLLWQTYNNKTQATNLWSLLITELGIPIWKAPEPLSTKAENPVQLLVGYAPTNFILVVWQEKLKDHVKIMYQKLDERGLPLGLEDGIMLEKTGSASFNTDAFGKYRKTIEKISWRTYNNYSRQSSNVEVAAQDLLLPEPAFNLFLGLLLYRCFSKNKT